MALQFMVPFLTVLLHLHVMLQAMFLCSTCTLAALTVPWFCAVTFSFKQKLLKTTPTLNFPIEGLMILQGTIAISLYSFH